jgi:SAM-dependent methyltransferase
MGIGAALRGALAEPATRGLSVDDPTTTVRRRDLAKTKKTLYLSNLIWYRELQAIERTAPPGARVELGSGGGFLDEHIAGLVTTDLLPLPFVKLVCRAETLPFEDATVGGIFMINVLHHVIDVEAFFRQVERVLRPGGVLGLIEPYVSPLSKLVYRHLHPEPFEPKAPAWNLEPSGPLSGGNDAMPWIVFVRDRQRFEAMYPKLTIERITPHTVLTRLLSGGVLMRSMVPAFLFPALQATERALPRWITGRLALFATIVVRKKDGHPRKVGPNARR